jgi:hypothetical protein
MERSNAPFGLIGKKLRAELDDANTQPLPKRWVDLIRHLADQERQKCDASAAERSRQIGRGMKHSPMSISALNAMVQ